MIMKTRKIILFVILMPLVSTLSAQFYMEIEGGVGGHSSVNQNKGSADAKGAINFGYLFWEKSDAEHTKGFMLEVGAEYNNLGITIVDFNSKSRADFVYTELVSRANTIKIPVLFGVEGVFAKSKMRYDLFLGFYFSQGLKSKGTLDGFSFYNDINANFTDIFNETRTFNGYKFEPLRNYNVGVRIGAKIVCSYNIYLKYGLDVDFFKMSTHQKTPFVFANFGFGYRLKFKG
jgi:hypothetical protein